MRFSVFLSLVALTLALGVPAGSAQADVVINIDKASQQMSVRVDGEEKYRWPISTAKRGYYTPSGTFKPFRMEPDHRSREFDDAPMPHSIFFTKRGHAIHGSFETNKLGRPASKGCVRLAPENAATLYQLVEATGLENTKVVISGGEALIAEGEAPRGRPVLPGAYGDYGYYYDAWPYAPPPVYRRGRGYRGYPGYPAYRYQPWGPWGPYGY